MIAFVNTLRLSYFNFFTLFRTAVQVPHTMRTKEAMRARSGGTATDQKQPDRPALLKTLERSKARTGLAVECGTSFETYVVLAIRYNEIHSRLLSTFSDEIACISTQHMFEEYGLSRLGLRT